MACKIFQGLVAWRSRHIGALISGDISSPLIIADFGRALTAAEESAIDYFSKSRGRPLLRRHGIRVLTSSKALFHGNLRQHAALLNISGRDFS